MAATFVFARQLTGHLQYCYDMKTYMNRFEGVWILFCKTMVETKIKQYETNSQSKFTLHHIIAWLNNYSLWSGQFSIECRKFRVCFGFYLTTLYDWLAANLAPISQPIRTKTKTNRALLARVFPPLTPLTCILLWLLIGSLRGFRLLWLVKWLTTIITLVGPLVFGLSTLNWNQLYHVTRANLWFKRQLLWWIPQLIFNSP